VPVQQLREWADCGYIRVKGQGERRRFDREALRQILAVRDAIRSGRLEAGHGSHQGASGASGASGISSAQHCVRQDTPELRRPEEFSVASHPTEDAQLALQTEMYFALNSGAPQTAAQMARHFSVPEETMEHVLSAMLAARRVMRVRCGGETLYGPCHAYLHGPDPREQRIRATHRTRIPSDLR